jgi:hypothetical protein
VIGLAPADLRASLSLNQYEPPTITKGQHEADDQRTTAATAEDAGHRDDQAAEASEEDTRLQRVLEHRATQDIHRPITTVRS